MCKMGESESDDKDSVEANKTVMWFGKDDG